MRKNELHMTLFKIIIIVALGLALLTATCFAEPVATTDQASTPADPPFITAWTMKANFSPTPEDISNWKAFLTTWKPYSTTLERLHLNPELPGVWASGPWEFRNGTAVLTKFPGYPIPWIAPYRYSALKDFHLKVRVKVIDDKINSWGVKLAAGWLPRFNSWATWYLNTGRLYLRKTYDAMPEIAKIDGLPIQERDIVVDMGMRYSLSERIVTVEMNGKTIITHAMEGDTAEEFEKINGYASHPAGLGVYSNGPCLEVQSMEISAGAPWARVVAIGDSITHHLYWPEALSKRLNEPVTNLGIGGDTADMMKTRIAHDVVALKPHFCFILIGSNDLPRSATAVASDVREAVVELKQAGIRPVLGAIIPRKKVPPYQIRAFNSALKKMAEEEKVPFVDWFDALLRPDVDGLGEDWSAGGDGTHPNDIGAQKMAEQIDPALFKE